MSHNNTNTTNTNTNNTNIPTFVHLSKAPFPQLLPQHHTLGRLVPQCPRPLLHVIRTAQRGTGHRRLGTVRGLSSRVLEQIEQ